ncbi:ABC transporter ATP-binding protein [Sungkyunkwania multivorans]|uniref:ABC transporter ATP-binding protein n=1 Tax=Sungkyunkwania multivorans TaxID=1173618 RepID=A0ABW3CZR6_9FLAO
MNYFRKILRFAGPYKKYAYLNIFFNILYALFSTLSFVALIPVLQVIFSKERVKYAAPVYKGFYELKDYLQSYLNYFISTKVEEHGEFKVLLYMIGMIITIFMLKNLFNYAAMFFITFLRNGVVRDLRNRLFKKVISLPIGQYSDKTKGDTIARLSSDVDEIRNSFLSVLEMIFREPLTILFSLITMIIFSVKLTLFVFVFIPVTGIIISRIGKSLKRSSTKLQKEQGTFLSIVEEALGGLKVIKAFTAEGIFEKKFAESKDRFYQYSNAVMNRQNLASPVSEFLGIIVIGVLLVYGGYLVFVEKTMEPSFFLGYIMLAYNILTPAKAISKASYSVKRGDAAATRVLEVLETENPIEDKVDAIAKNTFDERITIENVSFKYENDYVLKNFSIVVPKGKTIALVGQSGSGKSTIANLVTRFYDVNEGSINIDGIDIRDLKKASLRGLMGMVTQDSILFNDSVRNNILLGKENAAEEEIIEALQIANAYEFVMELPQGLDTNIGDSGNKLSGGQKQRLSIARAVLKNPPIMVLDEATSALDTESERLVQIALENMMKNRTSIVIAHRLSTIQNADTIVVMQKGKIVEQGSHDQLMANKGTYSKLVEMQSFE